jgi:hypothetical protein
MSNKSIEQRLYKDEGKLIKMEGFADAIIYDAELDPIELSFSPDGTITIETPDLEYITFDERNIEQLVRLNKEAKEYFETEEYKQLMEED